VADRFIALLEDAARDEPHRFAEITGAVTAVDAARAAGWTITLATGAWERSARLKLAIAGFDHRRLPLATSNDAVARTDIMRIAVERAGVELARCERIVAVGDGSWDVRAAAELGWPLVAIAGGRRAERLRRCGADTILADYQDLPAFFDALDHASVPRYTSADTRPGTPAY
jgi:phosphoglycolate phosphatase-like HAD superfamily hydrolase